MEWKFQVNWPALVEEARQRRKKQKLTQKRLALLAGISTPTLSRFESGKKDIQLSSILSILEVLGLVDKRHLIFTKPQEYYDLKRGLVFFQGQDGAKEVRCAISEEAIEDLCVMEKEDFLEAFRARRSFIEHKARQKYLANQWEKDLTILIKSDDF